jgi:hypothetical protein
MKKGVEHHDEPEEMPDETPMAAPRRRTKKAKQQHGGIRRNHHTGELYVPSSVPSMFPDVKWG